MSAKIIAALQQLDTKNDAHWTSDGLPRLETVRLFAGDHSVSREMLHDIAPGFSRAHPTLPAAETQAAGAADAGEGVQGTSDPVIAAPAAAQPAATAEGGDDAAAGQQGPGEQPSDIEAEPQTSAAQDALEAARARLDDASAAKAKADQDHQKAVAELDAAIDASVRAGAQETLAQQVRSYHQRQLEELQRRAAIRSQLNAAGLNLSELAKMARGSALDQAMARKNTRGTQRPNLPLRK